MSNSPLLRKRGINLQVPIIPFLGTKSDRTLPTEICTIAFQENI
ncbi:MAG: hypothetical protein AAFR77_23735 [Cyanobacteria bacterium J06631_2]